MSILNADPNRMSFSYLGWLFHQSLLDFLLDWTGFCNGEAALQCSLWQVWCCQLGCADLQLVLIFS
jgi:hypothetical protein